MTVPLTSVNKPTLDHHADGTWPTLGSSNHLRFPAVDRQSDEILNSLLEFSISASKADAAIFFWTGPQGEILDPLCLNFDEDALEFYNEVEEFDPLGVRRMKAQKTQVAVLSHYKQRASLEINPQYKAHLASANIGDELSMVFWKDQEPFACLVLTRAPHKKPFSLGGMDWPSLRAFAESSLKMHWRVRTVAVEAALVQRFSITPRELEVIRYVLLGKSNEQIASILGIGVPTIKSHIVSILNKTGADSRLGIACLVNSLQFR